MDCSRGRRPDGQFSIKTKNNSSTASVRLASAGSSTGRELQEWVLSHVAFLACGIYPELHDLLRKKVVNVTINMLEIATKIRWADNVVAIY